MVLVALSPVVYSTETNLNDDVMVHRVDAGVRRTLADAL